MKLAVNWMVQSLAFDSGLISLKVILPILTGAPVDQ
jgi:hypothetical protein